MFINWKWAFNHCGMRRMHFLKMGGRRQMCPSCWHKSERSAELTQAYTEATFIGSANS